jgi:hypothetical protein
MQYGARAELVTGVRLLVKGGVRNSTAAMASPSSTTMSAPSIEIVTDRLAALFRSILRNMDTFRNA